LYLRGVWFRIAIYMVNQGERTESDFSTTPQVLDIIKIDGRWAQSIIGGRTIIFLDDGASQEILWKP
jgi:hypothetical protein